jgi:predicted dehydrogenase/nucleoside-diphosphate-sugar epimerase
MWKVGLLGAGYISDWHLKALRAIPTVQVVAVCDLNRSRTESFAARHGIAGAFTSIDEMVKSGGCEAVHVLLPPELHFSAASQLLDAGVHVLLEKPACVNVSECDQLVEQAKRVGKVVGVSHNFLFAPAYERLRADVRAGLLGPIGEISIVWNKELGQLRGGPFASWMFREPSNVMLEIGPHSAAHLLDLLGNPESLKVEVDRPTILPSGKTFYRRWRVQADRGPARAELQFGLGGGFTEHRIHIRGWIASATCDFEAGTYVLRRRSPLPEDFDRYQITRNEAKALLKQGRRKLLRYVLSKFKLTKKGNDFGTSITRSLSAFYDGLQKSELDHRLSLGFASDVVNVCGQIGAEANRVAPAVNEASRTVMSGTASGNTVLVLGGTGFIGQALVRQLVEAGHPVRLLVRDPRNLPVSLHGLSIDVVGGDLSRPDDLDRAMTGVTTVCHLARAHVETWDDYVRLEIGGTRNVAEACLRAGVRRFLYTGTIDSCYTGSAGTIGDENALDPKVQRRNLYARAKAESERLLIEMREKQGLPLALFRPGIVIGAGGSPFHWGIGMWSGDAVCRIWGRGTNPLPIVLVDDVARALVRAVDADDVLGKSFNLVGPPLLSALEYVAELERCSGIKLDVRPTSAWRFYRNDVFKWIVKVLVRHPERRFPSLRDWKSRRQLAILDCANAKRILKWAPTSDRGTLIEEGIVKPMRAWLG